MLGYHLFATGLLLLGLQFPATSLWAAQTASPPSVVFQTEKGGSVLLRDLLAKTPPDSGLLLVFWASWCAPCLAELPDLHVFTKNQKHISTLLVVEDMTAPETTRAILNRHNAPDMSFVTDPTRDGLRILALNGLPAALLFDKKGREVWRQTGLTDWKAPELRTKLEGSIASTRQD